ncbi:MAG: hypothetical protein FJZ93_06935 [Chloroflexi bacterium]|nr:hypothetical protein [Chloroflexota bacterium]
MGAKATITFTSTGRTLGGDCYLWLGQWVTEPTETNFQLAKVSAPHNSYEVMIDFTVPEVPYKVGNYTLTLYNTKVNAEGAAASFNFKILPSLQVSPKQVAPGDQVTLKGTGFTAKQEILLTFDGKDTKQTLKTNGLGSFTTTFDVGNIMSGRHEFKASVPDTFGVESIASITVGPVITLQPNTLTVGEEVIVTGRGFAASSAISIIYDDNVITSSPTTDTNGSFSYTFKVPQSSKAEHTLIATDKAGNKATYGTAMESNPPPAPNPIQPRSDRFGWMGSKVVKFEWTEVSDESGVIYTLEIAKDLNFFPLEPGMRKTGLTKAVCLVSMPPGTYYWRVKAIDGAGNESPWTLSPYPFKVGFLSLPYLIIGGLLLVLILVLIVRAAFRRISEYT